jgi:hypothetical protein
MAAVLPNTTEVSKGTPNELPAVDINLADSRSLPNATCSVDAVISSPPYCTRIDYAVMTRAELAVLGYDHQMLRELRDQMIGTSTIASAASKASGRWGIACNQFLQAVKIHTSHASSSYYYKSHVQYFAALYQSLSEASRILRTGSPCVLVVQDSYYKDIHNDLPQYLTDMGEAIGLPLVKRFDYPVRHTLAGLHRHRKTYRSHAMAKESVLWMLKNGTCSPSLPHEPVSG